MPVHRHLDTFLFLACSNVKYSNIWTLQGPFEEETAHDDARKLRQTWEVLLNYTSWFAIGIRPEQTSIQMYSICFYFFSQPENTSVVWLSLIVQHVKKIAVYKEDGQPAYLDVLQLSWLDMGQTSSHPPFIWTNTPKNHGGCRGWNHIWLGP